jgi:hypothetical protein
MGVIMQAFYWDFIAICSHVLRRWCDFLHGEWKLPKDAKTRTRESGHTLVRYLRDVAGLNIADFGNWPEWTKFDAYFVARSPLVHDGGIIEDAHARKMIATLSAIPRSTLLLEEERTRRSTCRNRSTPRFIA